MFVIRNPLPPSLSSVLSPILNDLEQNSAALDELRSLSREQDPEIFQQSLMIFGLRQEGAGNSALAVRAYQVVQQIAGVSSELVKRAQSRVQALLGQGGSLGDQWEISSGAFLKQAAVTSAAMVPAWLAYSATRLTLWNGLAGRAAANLLTRGGSKAVASLLAIGLVEGPVLTATQRALGSSAGSFTEDLAANYRLMLGLRAASGAGSLVSRTMGLSRGVLQAAVQQASTLGGIYLTHDNLSLAQALQTLGYFHINGAVVGGILGRPFAAREQALAQAGARPTASGATAWQASLETGSPRLAQAAVGTVEPAQRSLRVESSPPPWQFHKVLARGRVEETGSSSQDLDTTGIKLLRKIRNMDIPNVRTESFIRRWIDDQAIAINVAHIVVNTRTVMTAAAKTFYLGGLVPGSDKNDVAQMRMLNTVFRQRLGWEENAVIGRSFRMFFEANRESFLAAAVSLARVNQDWEFGPRVVPVKFADGTFFPLVCAGTVRQVGDILWAFGAFTGFPGEASTPPSSPPQTFAPRHTGFPPAGDSVPPPARPSVLARSLTFRDAVDAELEEGRRAAGLPPRKRDDS